MYCLNPIRVEEWIHNIRISSYSNMVLSNQGRHIHPASAAAIAAAAAAAAIVAAIAAAAIASAATAAEKEEEDADLEQPLLLL